MQAVISFCNFVLQVESATGESKTEHDAHQTGGYRRKTGSTGNTHIDTQTDGTQGTEEGERERGTRETRHTHTHTSRDMTG